ncbi:hypothetical protein OF83DRAFT_1167013 [Amylostereum chailletii]|nr:hypothetical protein OF83DRAFT_1167013 [Amylostereum chailletii]
MASPSHTQSSHSSRDVLRRHLQIKSPSTFHGALLNRVLKKSTPPEAVDKLLAAFEAIGIDFHDTHLLLNQASPREVRIKSSTWETADLAKAAHVAAHDVLRKFLVDTRARPLMRYLASLCDVANISPSLPPSHYKNLAKALAGVAYPCHLRLWHGRLALTSVAPAMKAFFETTNARVLHTLLKNRAKSGRSTAGPLLAALEALGSTFDVYRIQATWPELAHCVRCHKTYSEEDNPTGACAIEHRVPGDFLDAGKHGKRSYHLGCCGRTFDVHTEDVHLIQKEIGGYCFIGKHVRDWQGVHSGNEKVGAYTCRSSGCVVYDYQEDGVSDDEDDGKDDGYHPTYPNQQLPGSCTVTVITFVQHAPSTPSSTLDIYSRQSIQSYFWLMVLTDTGSKKRVTSHFIEIHRHAQCH